MGIARRALGRAKKTLRRSARSVKASIKTARTDVTAQESHEIEEMRKLCEGKDRDHIWAFVSGQASQDFRGNPKYLFVYVSKYCKDILPYWICSDEETIQQVRSLGFLAFNYESIDTQYLMNRTGVVVTEQVKYSVPDAFQNVKYVNLWHGVGFKTIERRLFAGDIAMGIARKYILRGTDYRDSQLMVAPCETIEKEFEYDCGVDYDKFLRVGYPRCLYQRYFDPVQSFDHDIRSAKGLSPDSKLVVYAPTYRASLGNTFNEAIQDIEALYELCEKNNLLFIFKLHPNMDQEIGFLNAWKTFGNRPHFLFWDNRNDFYEIMDQIDLAIVDYSAIISDMVAIGIKHYIRYVFDFDEYMSTVDVHESNYHERTLGCICKTFDELLNAIETFETRDETDDIDRLNNLFWSYSKGKDDFEAIVKAVMDFKIVRRPFPTLYSFDIFDTLISRKVLNPNGIFYGVKELMESDGGFPAALVKNYPNVRHQSEFCEREYYQKSQDLRHTDHIEISFDQIFTRMGTVYGLSDEQVEKLKTWELNLELENVVPLDDMVSFLKGLVDEGNEVVLVSDMYLPKEIIVEMLRKADPLLADLPLFLSCEYGVQKTTQKLFFEVYKSFEPYYDFEKWVHYGDNQNADVNQARRFEISPRKVDKPTFGYYQNLLVETVDSYDGFLTAALQARMIAEHKLYWDEFVISFVSLCMVPYIDWVLRDAEERGYETLYFISRDGYHLQRIADEIIKARKLSIKTKLIYASRRVWRVPSYIDEVDGGFYEDYGNFNYVASKEKLLSAMCLDEATFMKFFPAINLDEIDFSNRVDYKALVETFRSSKAYNDYLLTVAAQGRKPAQAYLLQEVDAHEKHAFVEFYGRGYNQDCHVRLWRDAIGDPQASVAYYYARSILPSTDGSIRYNFTVNNAKQFFIEALFANMPYKSIESYQEINGRIEPVIKPIPYVEDLYDSMDALLPQFARGFASLERTNPLDSDRLLFDFVFNCYAESLEVPEFADKVGRLVDSTLLYGDKREFAPPFTHENLDAFEAGELRRGDWGLTSSITMSVTRTSPSVRERYNKLYQIMPGDNVAGGRVLTPQERETNQEYEELFTEMAKKCESWRDAYDEAIKTLEVTNTVLIVENGKSLKSQTLKRIKEAFENYEHIAVETLCLDAKQVDFKDAVQKLASARFVVCCKPIERFAYIRFRPQTECIFANSDPFNLYYKCLSATYYLKWQRKYCLEFGVNDFSVLQVPSPNQEPRYRANFTLSKKPQCKLFGSCVTDVYYEMTKEQAKSKLEKVFPESKGKKVVLYMPSLRPRKTCEQWAELIDFEALSHLVGDEWVLAFNYNKAQDKGYVNLGGYKGFARVLTGKDMPLRELMIAADAIVGDYRDTYFESVMLDTPVYSSAFDYETVLRGSGINKLGIIDNNQYEQLVLGPLVKTADDLANRLRAIDEYDYRRCNRMREKLFVYCDGHSAERIAEYIASNLGNRADDAINGSASAS